jgi:sarcosine oxidase subunit delta
MLLIRCPFCEMDRPELEFRYAGEAHLVRPDPATASDADWAAFLYFRDNPRGVHAERWRHNAGCGRYFNALRHTVSDRFLAAYKPGEPRPAVPEEGA